MYNLSKPQKSIYEMEKFVGGTASIICGSILIKGTKSLEELRKAVNQIYKINDSLRIHIVKTETDVKQEINDFSEREIDVMHFDAKEKLDLYADKYAKKPFNIYGTLCDIKILLLKESYGILIKLHHIVGDAWTLSLICSQFNAILSGKTPSAYSYIQYLDKEAHYLKSSRYLKDREFFLKQFEQCREVTYLSNKSDYSFHSERKTFILDPNQADKLMSYSQRQHVSIFILFMTALGVYINRTKMNVCNFYIGTAVLNRTGNYDKNTAGMFINNVPMLMQFDNSMSFAKNLLKIQQASFSLLRHQSCNYSDILSDIRETYHFTENLYDIALSYQNTVITDIDKAFKTTWYHSGVQTESLQIHIDDRDNENIFRLHYDYQTEKFTENEMICMHQRIMNLLFDAVSDDSKKLYELNILYAGEKRKLLYDFNNTKIVYPQNKCVHQIFEEQVKKSPNKTALIARDKIVTYEELNIQSNQIAHNLIKYGIIVGDIVAFSLPRQSCLLAVILGILKAGAAYLPIDIEYPQERIEDILSDSNPRLFITKENIESLLENDSKDNPSIAMTSNALCYCIYTSGSTGKPKGVLIRHRNLVNICSVNKRNFYQTSAISNNQIILSTAKCCFDAFAIDYALFLLNGNTVILADDSDLTDSTQLAVLAETYKADVLQSTPSAIRALCLNDAYAKMLKQIKVLILAAEKFTPGLYSYLRNMTDAVIFNGYGPSETTIGASIGKMDSEDIHIGKPVANTQIYIVDRFIQPVPVGIVGEICVAGAGVGAGYLNRQKLTEEKFIANPFGEGKLYKTGDLGCWREDGNIMYVGRNDFQVKVRGFRIELEEIENIISGIENILYTAVVVRKDNTGRQLICAFYTESAPVSVKQIKTIINKSLPQYMMPHIFIRLRHMPLMSNGKISRKALPIVNLNQSGINSMYVKPSGLIEQQIAQIMEQVLNWSCIGRDDNFFDLGGDSLKVIEFVAELYNVGIYLSPQNVFDYPSIAELSEYIGETNHLRVSFANTDFSHIDKVLGKNKIDKIPILKNKGLGNILLTGATGYLGIHILDNLLENDNGHIYCLLRGKDGEDSRKRLNELIEFYFGADSKKKSGHIKVLCGDLQKEYFGLEKTEYLSLISEVNTVINAAASVKHYGSYQYFYEINVESVKKIIEFCLEADAKLIHMSTLSVSGNSFADTFDGYASDTEKRFYESSLYIGQPLDNVYARSKFEAEKYILESMSKGLRANIMRLGNLTNRFSDGMFQKNHETNAFLKRIKALLELGMFPDYLLNLYVEFTPIDEAAEAIMTIVRHFNTEQTVFHINSTKVVYMDKLLSYFHELGCSLKVVDEAAFTEALRKTMENKEKEYIFETFINDMDSSSHLNYDSNIRIDNQFTIEYLKRLGFEWSDIDMEYLKKYINYFRKINYLEV